MDPEQEKVEIFFTEAGRLPSANLEPALGKPFFELWEQNNEPRPFIVSGSVSLGGRKLKLPSKGRHVAWFAWDSELERPAFFIENARTRHRFPLSYKGEEIVFGPPEKIKMVEGREYSGRESEVIYDVIDTVIAKKTKADVLKITKKEFSEILGELSDIYGEKLLKKMNRLSAAKMKQLIRQAATDMAVDELGSQMGLPLDNSYAYDTTGGTAEFEQINESPMRTKTRWEAVLEIELLAAMARANYELRMNLKVSLDDSEIIDSGQPGHAFVRIPGLKDMPFYEGLRLGVRKKDTKGNIGLFNVGMFDYDTVYGEIFWDAAGEPKQLSGLYLVPKKEPTRFMVKQINMLREHVNVGADTDSALGHVLGFKPMGRLQYTDAAPAPEMDYSQKKAWSASVHPENRVVAVQGPPGTGKTRLLAQVVRHLCEQGRRVLVTAPSNTAVDNVCKHILDLPLLRLGQSAKIAPEVTDTCWIGIHENVETYLKKRKAHGPGAVYAATQVRALFDNVVARELEENGLFDAVVFDEVGMTHMDEFLLCARMAKRVVAFGDHQQLPPFPLPKKALDRLNREHGCIASHTRDIIDYGGLEWLARNRNLPMIMLQRSYRCQNPRLLRFSSTLFYSARVKTSEKAEYFRLPYNERKIKYPRSTLRFYKTSGLGEDIRRENVLFEENGPGIDNPCEANICREVLLEALTEYKPWEVMIISPYRRQVALIRALLEYEAVRDRLPKSVREMEWDLFLKSKIATVDSFQGGEDELVIISYVRSNDGRGIGFVDSPNRINVAHTRCKRGIAIIGDLECLKKQAKTDIFVRMERAFLRDGEIIDVDLQ